MAESHMKTKAYQYGKEFKLDTFITNLQAYRLAAGEVNPGDYSAAREKHGNDEGAVFGEIITASSACSKGDSTRNVPTEDGRIPHVARAYVGGSRSGKRKRRRRKRKAEERETQYRVPSAKVKKAKPDFSSSLVSADYASSSDSDSSRELFELPHNLLSAMANDRKPAVPAPTVPAEPEKDTGDYFNLASASSSDSSDEMYTSSIAPVGDSVDPALEAPCTAVTGASYLPVDGTVRLAEDQLSKNQPRLALPEDKDRKWSYDKHKWSQSATSSLSTYRCWKCNRIGHLPQDCVSTCTVPSAHPALPGVFTQEKREGQQIYSKLLRDYYGRCRQLQRKSNLSCAECGACSNLANCLDCGMTFCDGRGHLAAHLVQYSSHRKLYSGKLKRQIKCCKPTCEVMDVSELYCCSSCWSKVFDRHYSMINATWSAKGLNAIVNGLCCDEHFQWHRMNCDTSTSEQPFSMSALHQHNHSSGLISEFLF